MTIKVDAIQPRRVAAIGEKFEPRKSRANGMQPGKLLTEALQQRVAGGFQPWIPHQLVAGGHPGNPAHDKKCAADDGRVIAQPKWLGNGDARSVHRLEHGELFAPRKARLHPGIRIGAQHQGVSPMVGSALHIDVQGVVFLNGAATQKPHVADLQSRAVTNAGQKLPHGVHHLLAQMGSLAAAVQPHDQKSVPSFIRFLDNTILCTSEAPSTKRA